MTAMAMAGPRWRRFAPLALFALLALLLGVGLTLKPREVPSPFIGKAAPAFTLPLLADPASTFTPAAMQGRVWLLNVWASWCAPCREEHPLLVAMAREEKVAIVGLNYKDDRRNAQEWLLRLGDPYLMTAVDADGRAGIDWGVYGVPETFVVDAGGVVRHKVVGPLTQQVWLREVKPLLQQLQPGGAR
jgi:cytochrome c biogenesis protein CcmG, thiol:disulfide interchange protein DsbE